MKENTDVAGQTHTVTFMFTSSQRKADASFVAAKEREIGFIQTKVGIQPEPEQVSYENTNTISAECKSSATDF